MSKRTVEVELSTTGLDAHGRPQRVPILSDDGGGGLALQAPPALEPELEGEHMLINRSEEHTSELQSPCNLVCRLLLEKKKSPSCTKSRTAMRTTRRARSRRRTP